VEAVGGWACSSSLWGVDLVSEQHFLPWLAANAPLKADRCFDPVNYHQLPSSLPSLWPLYICARFPLEPLLRPSRLSEPSTTCFRCHGDPHFSSHFHHLRCRQHSSLRLCSIKSWPDRIDFFIANIIGATRSLPSDSTCLLNGAEYPTQLSQLATPSAN
jgi:hypothetical protein